MARIRSLEKKSLQRNATRSEADATYSVYTDNDGNVLLQIDTYGSDERKIKNKKSQSIQLDAKFAKELHRVLARTFNL